MLLPHYSITITAEDTKDAWWYGHSLDCHFRYLYIAEYKNYVLQIGMNKSWDRWANSVDFYLICPHEHEWLDIFSAINDAISGGAYNIKLGEEFNLFFYIDQLEKRAKEHTLKGKE